MRKRRRVTTVQGRVVYDRARHVMDWKDVKRILDHLPADAEVDKDKLWEIFESFAHALLPGVAWQIIEACKPIFLAWLGSGGPKPGEPGNPA